MLLSNVSIHIKAFVWLCIASLVLTACSNNQLHKQQLLIFGTTVDVSIWHNDTNLVQSAFSRLNEDFQRMHNSWHPWQDSTIKRTNQLLRSGEWFTASTSVLPLLEKSRQLSIQSRGYFNPAIGELVQLWGFHRSDPNNPYEPDMEKIHEIQQQIPTMQDIEQEGIRMRGNNPHLQFDPGGIAKGYAIDLAIQTLRAMGIENALINAGGDLAAIGSKNGTPWRVGIQHPRSQVVMAAVDNVSNESVFTSGDYQRYYLQGSERRHHIINPFTGEPSADTIAVTVIHKNATIADAAATAVMAAGKNHWQEVAASMNIDTTMLLTTQGELHMTSKMQKRIQLINSNDFSIHVH